MREVDAARITEAVYDTCQKIAFDYAPDILARLKRGRDEETTERSIAAMDQLLENAELASTERIPICQDTGLVTVWLHVGQDVHVINGSVYEAVQQGVSKSYTEHRLRASVVSDPLFERVNTRDNTPAVIYTELVSGDSFRIELTAKGFGSENMSRLKMLKPAEGLAGVKDFVLETIKLAGPNACPPMIVGVGVGGTFDYSAYLSKRALLRPLDEPNPDPRWNALEQELEAEANQLHIGPMGFHGNTTALAVKILSAPTHIAGLPCAVNICCHACRHKEVEL